MIGRHTGSKAKDIREHPQCPMNVSGLYFKHPLQNYRLLRDAWLTGSCCLEEQRGWGFMYCQTKYARWYVLIEVFLCLWFAVLSMFITNIIFFCVLCRRFLDEEQDRRGQGRRNLSERMLVKAATGVDESIELPHFGWKVSIYHIKKKNCHRLCTLQINFSSPIIHTLRLNSTT